MRMISKLKYQPGVDNEKRKGVSCTVPDESMSVKEIYERFAQGQILPIARSVSGYRDEPDFDAVDLEGLKRMDRVEQDEIVSDLVDRQLRDDAIKGRKVRIAKKKKDAAEAAERAEFDKWKLAQKDPKPAPKEPQ